MTYGQLTIFSKTDWIEHSCIEYRYKPSKGFSITYHSLQSLSMTHTYIFDIRFSFSYYYSESFYCYPTLRLHVGVNNRLMVIKYWCYRSLECLVGILFLNVTYVTTTSQWTITMDKNRNGNFIGPERELRNEIRTWCVERN